MTKRFAINSIYATSMLLIVIMRIVTSVGAFSALDDLQQDGVWSSLVQIIIMGIIPFFLYVIYLAKKGDKKPFVTVAKSFGYTRNISARGWLIVLAMSLLTTYEITCISSVWYDFISLLGYKSAITPTPAPYTPAVLVANLALTAVLPAVFEEFTNRGLLTEGHRGRPVRTILLTAAMFALMHTSVTQVFYTFIFGIIAGALTYVTRSIWPAMLLHFVNNFVSVIKTYGRLNGNWLSFINRAYNWLLGTVVGGTVATILFVLIAIVIFFLFVRLADTESTRRLKLNLPPRDEDGQEAVALPRGKYDELPLYFTIILNVIVTALTFVWGVMR